MLVLALAMIFAMTSVALASFVKNSDKINEVLTSYFTAREKEYYGQEKNAFSVNDDALDRLEAISKWKNGLGIDVTNVENTFFVTNILSQSDYEAKIEVYEWVTIDYQFFNEGQPRLLLAL